MALRVYIHILVFYFLFKHTFPDCIDFLHPDICRIHLVIALLIVHCIGEAFGSILVVADNVAKLRLQPLQSVPWDTVSTPDLVAVKVLERYELTALDVDEARLGVECLAL